MLKFFDKHPEFWATHLWNMFDFSADARDQGGEPGMNHKGLVTFDRKVKKDAFYLYKAYWSDEPFIYLCGKRFINRTGRKLKIKVYSNRTEIELIINGKPITKTRGTKIFTFVVPMQKVNEITVKAGNLTDSGTVIQVDRPDPSYKLTKKVTKNWQK